MHKPPRERLHQALALATLLALTGFALAGPTGLLSWRESAERLEQRRAQIAVLTERRDALRNRVELLDPQSADPDLVSELVRRDLGVLHPDDVIVTLEER